MEVIKEGTHTCLLQRIVHNENNTEDEVLEYYLAVEYEVLKRNFLKTLIPVQLREKDGEKSLLFDITGKQPLKKREKEKGFSQKECERILQGIVDLLEDIDNYMLDLNCVEFCPEYIYVGASGEIQWIYCPQTVLLVQEESNIQGNRPESKDFQGRIEDFFAWILTQIDYEDTEAVPFMYRFYDKIRKMGFSKELLEKYIISEAAQETYRAEIQQDNNEQLRKGAKTDNRRYKEKESLMDGNASYENFFKEDLELEEIQRGRGWKKENVHQIQSSEKQADKLGYRSKREKNDREWKETRRKNKQRSKPGNKQSINRQKDKEKNRSQNKQWNKEQGVYSCLSIVFLIFVIGASGLEIFFVYSGIQRGFTELLFRYSIGGMILILTCIFGTVWSIGRIKAIQDISKEEEYIKNVSKKKEYIKESANNEKRMIKTEAEWEADGEGTTILSGNNGTGNMPDSYFCPMLREEETGIIYLIKDCPFYIGSAGGNQLEIQDKTVSREHAVILENIYIDGNEGYSIQDLDSTNGTWINDKKMRKGSRENLKEGTMIRFAENEYKFLLQDI